MIRAGTPNQLYRDAPPPPIIGHSDPQNDGVRREAMARHLDAPDLSGLNLNRNAADPAQKEKMNGHADARTVAHVTQRGSGRNIIRLSAVLPPDQSAATGE